MTFILRGAGSLLLLSTFLASTVHAQAAATIPLAPKAAAVTPSASAAQHTDASVKHTVIEDDGVRIEETRQRGAARRIVVHSKVPGVREYEIQVAPGGRDPAQERGGAGQRAWSLFSF
jgi:hypothetical protein